MNPSSNVYDKARIFSEDTIWKIEDECDKFFEELGNDIMVVTLPKLPNDCANPKESATRLFNLWRIGSEMDNKGILVLMVMSERRIEIEIGDGLLDIIGKSKSNWLQKMQENHMVPLFKERQYSNGIILGVRKIREYLQKDMPLDKVEEPDNKKSSNWGSYVGTVGALSALLYFIVNGRKEYCTCGKPYSSKGLDIDFSELNREEQLEHKAGTVRFIKYHCKECGKAPIRKIINSGVSICPNCKVNSVTKQRTRVKVPTESQEGLDRTITSCRLCSYSTSYETKIPKRSRASSSSSNSSSSSSSGSSYSSSSSSGGFSSGGGSGASW